MNLKKFIIVVILFKTALALNFNYTIIFNNYQIIEQPIEIGRVYNFGYLIDEYSIQTKRNYLNLTEYGLMTINSNVTTDKILKFKVLMKRVDLNNFIESIVSLKVTILTDEIINNSATMTISGVTSEQFISSSNGESKSEQLINFLNKKLNTKSCVVSTNKSTQIISIQKDKSPFILDVRFAVMSEKFKKIYFHHDKLHWILLENKVEIENILKITIKSIGIDQCLSKESNCESCSQTFKQTNQFTKIVAKDKSFRAPVIELDSVCANWPQLVRNDDEQSYKVNEVKLPGKCYNLMHEIKHFKSMHMSFDLIPDSINGNVLLFTPRKFRNKNLFLLELINGFPTLIFDSGNSEHIITIDCAIKLSEKSSILISFQQNMIKMIINNNDNCKNSTIINHNFFNFNFVLQHGSTFPNIQSIAKYFNWTHKPHFNFINGQIQDLKITTFRNQDFQKTEFGESKLNYNNKEDEYKFTIILIIMITTIIFIIISVLLINPLKRLVRTLILSKIDQIISLFLFIFSSNQIIQL